MDIDGIIDDILTGERYEGLRSSWNVTVIGNTEKSAQFELDSRERRTSQPRALMNVDILNLNYDDEFTSQKSIDYQISHIEKRINEIKALPKNPYIVTYTGGNYTIMWSKLEIMGKRPVYYLISVCGMAERLDEALKKGRIKFNSDELITITENLCHGLIELHNRDILHHYITPDNVYISTAGTYMLGRIGIENDVMKNSMIMFEPKIINDGGYNQQSDIYMLGKTLSYAAGIDISGKSNLYRSRKKDIYGIISRACLDNPDERYKSVEAMLKDVENLKISLIKKIPWTYISIGAAFLISLVSVTSMLLNSKAETPEPSVSEEPMFSFIDYEAEKELAQQKAEEEKEKKLPSKGDVNHDGYVDAIDAANILDCYSKMMTMDYEIDEKEKSFYDVDEDGYITACDASIVLGYYSYASTAKRVTTFDDYLCVIVY